MTKAITTSLRHTLLQQLHACHLGSSKYLQTTKKTINWLGLYDQIYEFVQIFRHAWSSLPVITSNYQASSIDKGTTNTLGQTYHWNFPPWELFIPSSGRLCSNHSHTPHARTHHTSVCSKRLRPQAITQNHQTPVRMDLWVCNILVPSCAWQMTKDNAQNRMNQDQCTVLWQMHQWLTCFTSGKLYYQWYYLL